MLPPILQATGLSKKYGRDPGRAFRHALTDLGRELAGQPTSAQLRRGEFWALQDVDFTLHPGEVLGVIGHNGAGKSTLIDLVSGAIRPTAGRLRTRAQRVVVMDHRGGLSAALTGRENIRHQLAVHGCPREVMARKEQEIITFAELGAVIDAPAGSFSLGMRQRLAFSIYGALEPDLYIVDEALNGGDIRFRQKFAAFLKTYVDRGGSMLLCSHDLFTIQLLCSRALLLDSGRLVAYGDAREVVERYMARMEATDQTTLGDVLGEEGDAVALALPSPQPTRHSEHPSAVRIDSLVITPGGAAPIFPGDSITLTLTCHAAAHIPRVGFAVEFFRARGVAMTGVGHGFDRVAVPLHPGRNTLTCTIAPLPLVAGDYELRTSISDLDTSAQLAGQGVEDHVVPLRIASRGDVQTNMTAVRRHVVHLPASWQVVHEAVTA